MKVIMLRSNPILPDPRVEKESYTLKNRKIDVEILAWDRQDNYKTVNDFIVIKNLTVPIHRFGIRSGFGGGIKSNLVPMIKYQIRILTWLLKNRKNYDIIHACDFDTALTGFICAKLMNKKIVYDIFDYYVEAFSVPNKLKRFIKFVDNFIIGKSDAVIICTEKRRLQINNPDIKNLVVIHNSPDLFLDQSDEPNEGRISNMVKIVYVGILQEGRFVKELIDVIKGKGNCELHIAGFGVLENYVSDASKVYGNIKYYGKISYENTLQLERECDIMTAIYDPKIPNHFYAAPNKFYEAFMLGKPLIMIKNTGMAEYISKYELGKVIDFNTESLNTALDELIKEKKKWPLISEKMKRIYKEKFRWGIMDKRLINLYRNL